MIGMRWAIRGIGLLSTILLARLLTPEDFGVVAMAMVAVALLSFIVLGLLDSVLTVRGGIPAYEYLLLILFGACVFAIGAVRGQQRPSAKAAEV